MGLLTESGPSEWHPASPELKAVCKTAADLCKKKGKDISKLAMQYSLSNKDISTILVRVNVVAAKELANSEKDEQILAEVEEILKPVKNQTWPSGIQQS